MFLLHSILFVFIGLFWGHAVLGAMFFDVVGGSSGSGSIPSGTFGLLTGVTGCSFAGLV
jgi:hypothetical protein